jgi:hypothetical protein
MYRQGKNGEQINQTQSLELQVKVVDWPTPNVPNRGAELDKSHRPNAGGIDLQSTVQLWQTPNSMLGGNKSRGGKRIGELLLAGQVKAEALTSPATTTGSMIFSPAAEPSPSNPNSKPTSQWPTPKARDVKGQSERGQHCQEDALPNMVAGQAAPDSPNSTGNRQGCSAYQEYIRAFGLSSARLIRRWWEHRERRKHSRKKWRPLPALKPASLWSPWVAALQGYPSNWCDVQTSSPSKPTETQSCHK